MKYFYIFFLLVSLSSCAIGKVKSDSEPISHEIWDGLLKKHVSSDGKVDYRGFIEDSLVFNNYIKLLKENHPNDQHWTDNEQLAYWINAYNAFTVQVVIRHYPKPSIKDIKKGIPFVNTVWDIKFIQIEEETYDLNNLEHGIIRSQFTEPRIHFAVNCASISCPNLRNSAYTAEKLDEQLEEQARKFINDPSKNKLTATDPKLSKIFFWFSSDFKNKAPSVIEFINKYADSLVNTGASIDYLEYNWGLNGK